MVALPRAIKISEQLEEHISKRVGVLWWAIIPERLRLELIRECAEMIQDHLNEIFADAFAGGADAARSIIEEHNGKEGDQQVHRVRSDREDPQEREAQS